MAGAISLVAAVMIYDEQREFESALLALRDEQVSLATAVAADFEARLEREEEIQGPLRANSHIAQVVTRLLGGAHKLEQPGSRLILVGLPSHQGFVTHAGSTLRSPPLEQALSAGKAHLILSRQEAEALQLPHRLAVAGLARVATKPSWSVAVVASAERLRARERRAQLRVLLGVLVAASLVGAFGGLALRMERREVATAQQLELAALQRDRERILTRSDKMTTLAALSSGIAHQVATPLGIILARVDQVRATTPPESKIATTLEVVADQVTRIQRVMRGVLALARGKQPTLLPARPLEVLSAALAAVQHRFEQAGVTSHLHDGHDLLPDVLCDPPMLEQAVVNLLLNACEASRRGDTIDVRAEHIDGNVSFVIEDHGEGISEDAVARATEPFFTTKSERGGTGLGLAIANEIAAHHHGSLALQRRDPSGTRAILQLPKAGSA